MIVSPIVRRMGSRSVVVISNGQKTIVPPSGEPVTAAIADFRSVQLLTAVQASVRTGLAGQRVSLASTPADESKSSESSTKALKPKDKSIMKDYEPCGDRSFVTGLGDVGVGTKKVACLLDRLGASLAIGGLVAVAK